MANSRVRVDSNRRTGNANAVAAGVDLTQVGVVSDRELNWIRRLAYETEGAVDDYLRSQEERRKAASAARTAQWTDTKEAKHGEFLRSQAAAAEEAERRREELDQLLEEQDREAHRARVAQLQLKQLKEDPRGRNIQHAILLHEVMKGREEQIAYSKSKEKDVIAEERRELEEMQRKHWGEEAEERSKLLLQRQKNMDEKATNLEAVMYQLQERRKHHVDEKELREFIDQEAEDEKRENEEEERRRKELEMENGLWNKANARKAVTKHERLDERIKQFTLDEQDRIREESVQEERKRKLEEKQRIKREDLDRRKVASVAAYLAEKGDGSPTYKTQNIFARKQENFVLQLAEGDSERQKRMAQALIEAKNYPADEHRKAEASASGFHNKAEEREYVEEMRGRAAQVRAEEAERVARLREESDRVARIQRLQAAEKREHNRRQVELDRETARRQQAYQEESDKKYAEYLKAQIPDDMDDYLREKALQMS